MVFKIIFNKEKKRKTSLNEILNIFKEKGKSVEGSNYFQAIEWSLKEMGKKGYISSIPTITYLRNELPFKHQIWLQDYDGSSIAYKGKDIEGFFGKKEEYLITTHNLKMPTLKSLLKSKLYSVDLDKGINYKQEVFNDLIHGKTAQGKKIELFHIEDFIKIKERQEGRFGVAVPLSAAPKKEYLFGINNFVREHFIIAMKGTPLEDLEIYSHKLDKKLSLSVKNPGRRMFHCQDINNKGYTKPVQAQILYTSSLGISTGQNFGANPHRFFVASNN